MKLGAVASLAIAAALSLGCVVIDDRRPSRVHVIDDRSDPPQVVPGAGDDRDVAIEPMLVTVDTNGVMEADAGQGVGVFTEYHAGGLWYVWWTCDTAITRQSCDFAVTASVTEGSLSVEDSTLGGASATSDGRYTVARTSTANEVHALTLRSDPGVTLTVEATVGGVRDGSFLFFVRDGAVNGGYGGQLTNPLRFQGDAP